VSARPGICGHWESVARRLIESYLGSRGDALDFSQGTGQMLFDMMVGGYWTFEPGIAAGCRLELSNGGRPAMTRAYPSIRDDRA
jgi:hypothetical protein